MKKWPKRVSLRLTEEHHQKLTEDAKDKKIGLSEYLRIIIEKYLEQ